MTGTAEWCRSHRGGPGHGVAARTGAIEPRLGDAGMPAAEERYQVRGLGSPVAEGVVGAAGGRARWGGRRGMPGRIRSRPREVALRTDGGVHWIGGGVVRSGGVMPRLGRVRRGHAVAGRTGFRRHPPGEVFAMTDLAGDQAAAVGPRGQLGPRAVDGHRAPVRNGLVVAEGGSAGRDIAACTGDRKLVALGAGIHPGDCATWVTADPSGGVVVLSEARGRGAGTASSTAASKEGQRKREGQPNQTNNLCQAFRSKEIDG